MTEHAKATFTLANWTQQRVDEELPPLAWASAEKTFHGDLEAHSTVRMLTAGDPSTGSAGYVAMERVTGTLHGRHGAFILQHNATSARGTQTAELSIVPASGSGELAGISGAARIEIDPAGGHLLQLDYVVE